MSAGQRVVKRVRKGLCAIDQPGHKAPDCPKKKNKQGGLNLTPGEKPKFVNWVAVTSTSETIPGKINGFTTDLVVDMGTEITMFRYEGQILPDTVETVGVTGVPMSGPLKYFMAPLNPSWLSLMNGD